MLYGSKEQPHVAAALFGSEYVLPLAAAGVYPKTRVWGSEPENVHCSSAIAPLRIELRWGCEESSEKTAVGSGVSFKYDPFGRRTYKSSSSGTSIYAYDSDTLIEEVNTGGTAVVRYTQSGVIDEPLAVLRGGATNYYHADGLGSVTSLSNSAGALAQTYGYDSFGKQTSSSGSLTNPFQYTAREFDSETGLYYNRARYYDPLVGRFLSEDPSNVGGGQYLYVGNSPTNLVDPSGLNADDVLLNKVTNALQNLINLLPKDPECLNWLCSQPKDDKGNDNSKPLDFLSQLLQFKLYGVVPIQPTQHGDGTLSIINGETGAIAGQAITINTLGAGFNSTYTSPQGKTYPLSTDNGRIPGGTNTALGFILLHELAHNTGVIAHDLGDEKAGRNNNDLIRKH
jgi:RHS repeat-associated protein